MATAPNETKPIEKEHSDLLAPDQPAIDKLVAALVRIRSVDTLKDALITRTWLAADMRVSADELDRLLKLLRWHGLIGLPNDDLVTVEDHEAMRAIALGCSRALAGGPILEQRPAGYVECSMVGRKECADRVEAPL